MRIDFTQLTDEVTQQETVEAGAATLMTNLFNEVEASKNDPAALQALVDRGRNSTAALSAAILANTPTIGTPVPASTPAPTAP